MTPAGAICHGRLRHSNHWFSPDHPLIAAWRGIEETALFLIA
jgi:hypothetical protein